MATTRRFEHSHDCSASACSCEHGDVFAEAPANRSLLRRLQDLFFGRPESPDFPSVPPYETIDIRHPQPEIPTAGGAGPVRTTGPKPGTVVADSA